MEKKAIKNIHAQQKRSEQAVDKDKIDQLRETLDHSFVDMKKMYHIQS